MCAESKVNETKVGPFFTKRNFILLYKSLSETVKKEKLSSELNRMHKELLTLPFYDEMKFQFRFLWRDDIFVNTYFHILWSLYSKIEIKQWVNSSSFHPFVSEQWTWDKGMSRLLDDTSRVLKFGGNEKMRVTAGPTIGLLKQFYCRIPTCLKVFFAVCLKNTFFTLQFAYWALADYFFTDH